MNRLSRLTIPQKIYGLIGLLFLMIVTVAGSLLWILSETNTQYADLLNRRVVAVVEEMRIFGELQHLGRQMNRVLLNAPSEGVDKLTQSLADTKLAIATSLSLGLANADGATAAALAEVKAHLPEIMDKAAATIAIKRAAGPDEDAVARAMWESASGRPLVLTLYTDIERAANEDMRTLRELTVKYTERTNHTGVISAAVIAVGLIGSALLAYVVATLGIARPLGALAFVMRRLAEQDMSVEVLGRERVDEVGVMATAVQVMKDNALHAQAFEREQAEARARRVAEDEQVKAAAEREAAALVVGSIGAGLARLATGDLTFRLETTLPAAYETLRADLNAAMAQLHTVMHNIVTSTSGLRAGTAEIAQASDDLSRRTEQQAARLEETAAALEEVTTTVLTTAESAKQARAVVSRTKTEAEHSGEVVRQAVAAMGGIEQSSQQIGQIISVIDEIAFQTNLLALNAGVEAARAGDAGRGFAVVASEVRALAQRSAEAAKEIKSLISASAQQVGAGVKLVGETGQALDRIMAQMGEINGAVSAIAASASEQATGLAEVNNAITQMDKVTQQNAAMVEQTTVASHSLAQETAELARLTENFQFETSSSTALRGTSGERTASTVVPLRTRTKSPRAISSPTPSRAAAAVRKPVAAVSDGSWEEF